MSRRAESDLGWRQSILTHFTSEAAAAARLTIVADPDDLLAEPGVIEEIRARGFELIPFEDHVAFRYAYEARFRSLWDRGESTPLVVVLRTTSCDFDEVPHDLVEEARRQSRLLPFSLAEVFPRLSPHVVGELDRADLDALFRAQTSLDAGSLGENGTRDFVLRHVYRMAPELIRSEPELLVLLFQRHRRGRVFPPSLDARLQDVLAQSRRWLDWPLERILPDREAFLTFLEERWPWFLLGRGIGAVPGREPSRPSLPGPRNLPFDHDDVRWQLAGLFLEGALPPTPVVSKDDVEEPWMAIGVRGNLPGDAAERLALLLPKLREMLPGPSANHRDWQDVALSWAEAVRLRAQLKGAKDGTVVGDFESLHDAIEASFGSWMLEHYASLPNLAHLPSPVTVDKIVPYLSLELRRAGGRSPRIALLVVDGLALDQWLLFRDDLREHLGATLEERTAFAWVPTLTAVSRQAIFSGDAPFLFPASISTTQKDPRHWARVWEGHGHRGASVQFVSEKKQETETSFLDRVRESAAHPACRVLGIVVGMIDRMMHGNVTGTGGVHAEIRHWLGRGHFRSLVEALLEEKFQVYLTSDHGNIEGVGIGKPDVGAVADERGERVHVFRDDLTRSRVKAEYEGAVEWPETGLPSAYRALLARGRGAFISRGARTVAHGGIALEEVIVPFVRIRGEG
jgi:hypothetical protein